MDFVSQVRDSAAATEHDIAAPSAMSAVFTFDLLPCFDVVLTDQRRASILALARPLHLIVRRPGPSSEKLPEFLNRKASILSDTAHSVCVDGIVTRDGQGSADHWTSRCVYPRERF